MIPRTAFIDFSFDLKITTRYSRAVPPRQVRRQEEMQMLRFRSALPFAIVAFAGLGCHARPPATAPARTTRAPSTVPARPPAPTPPPPAAAPAPAPLSEEELFRRKSLDELNAEHPLADVFFDYDQNVLRDDAKQALQKDAAWLQKWPQTVVLVSGHCDERGSEEYNLALGGRRADVVKEYLTSLGIAANRIQTRSVGKESPFCTASEESCWSQNRRGHFLITAK
jgi:peptidoglycan-associated lipoprotein